MRNSLFVILLVFCSGYLHAQRLTNVQNRKLNLHAIEIMEDYELLSRLASKSSRYNFIRMFESSTSSVFCDLYNNGDRYCDQISVSQYTSFVQNNCENIDVRISNIRKKGVKVENGRLYYALTFDKMISFNDMNGVLFPVEEGNAKPFRLEVVIVFDENAENPKIHEIKASEKIHSEKRKYVIIQKSENEKFAKIERNVSNAGSGLFYNSFGQAAVEYIDLEHSDEDIEVSYDYLAKTDVYDLIQLKYRANRMRLKLRNEIAPVMYALSDRWAGLKSTSFGYSVGLDLGITFPMSEMTKGGMYIGAALSYSTLKTQNNEMPGYVLSFSDSKGVFRELSYDISSVNQRASFTDIVFPVYFNFATKVHEKVEFIADFGAKAYVHCRQKVTEAQAQVTVSENHPKKVTFLGDTYVSRPSHDISAFLSLGVDVELIRKYLYLEAKLGYEHGFVETKSVGNASVIDVEKPVLYSGALNKDVLVAPLVNGVSFVRRAVWINLGVKFKF